MTGGQAATGVATTEVLAEVVRSGFVEGRHRGSVVALSEDGSVAFAVGDPDLPIFPRSSNKPLQGVGMLRAGLDLDGELLALACASHSGEEFHLAGVRRILAGGGLDESDLQTPADFPVDEATKVQYIRAGGQAAPLAMNCSGKHAAMLATCVHNGWDTATYLDPEHPLQQALLGALEDLAGEPASATGVDGCGAPLWALTLSGLARAFRAVSLAPAGSSEHRVAAAIRAHPEWLGGTGRDVTLLMGCLPGLIAKDGAEGVYVASMPDGRAVAVKIEDGGQRARPPVMVAALRRLGVSSPGLDDIGRVPLFGGGVEVGEVRVVM